MKLRIIEKKDNALFGRREIRAILQAEITPSREHILDLISKEFEVPMENIKIKGINGNFGTKEFGIDANIYNSKEEKDMVELKKKKENIKAEAPAQ